MVRFSESQHRALEYWLDPKEQRPGNSADIKESLNVLKGRVGKCEIDQDRGMRQVHDGCIFP